MGIVARKRRPTVAIDSSLTHECSECGEAKPRTNEYFHTRGHGSNILVNICKPCQSLRDRATKGASNARRSALALTDPREVVFDDLGTRAAVGWCGDVEYFPITPLLALTRYETEHGLLGAIREDALTRDLPRKFVINDLRGAPSWCLPWSHFSAFCLKFGNRQTKPQQERAQKVLADAFGSTAQSNIAAVQRMDRSSDLVPVYHRLDSVETKLDQVIEWTSSVDKVQRTIRLRGGLYLARFRDEELSTPAALLAEYGIKDAAHWLDRGYMLVSIGKSSKDTSKRVAKHSGKLPVSLTRLEATFEIDDPDTGENYLRNNPPSYPIAYKVKQGRLKDWFWLRRDMLDALKSTWPQYVTIADLTAHCKGWVFATMVHTYAQAALFL